MKSIIITLLFCAVHAHALMFTFEGTVTGSTLSGVNQGDPFRLMMDINPASLWINWRFSGGNQPLIQHGIFASPDLFRAENMANRGFYAYLTMTDLAS